EASEVELEEFAESALFQAGQTEGKRGNPSGTVSGCLGSRIQAGATALSGRGRLGPGRSGRRLGLEGIERPEGRFDHFQLPDFAYRNQKAGILVEAQCSGAVLAEHLPARLDGRGDVVDRQAFLQIGRQQVEPAEAILGHVLVVLMKVK